jgi:hypothetical protein
VTTVEILHNTSSNASFGLNSTFGPDPRNEHEWVKGEASSDAERHQLVKVFEYEDEDGLTVLETVYDRFNNDPEDDVARAYRARRLRSLEVGDVVVIDGHPWSVERAGFKGRQPGELRVVADPAQAETLVRDRYGFRPAEQLAITIPWSA